MRDRSKKMIPAMASPRREPMDTQMITRVLGLWEFEAPVVPGKTVPFGRDELDDG